MNLNVKLTGYIREIAGANLTISGEITDTEMLLDYLFKKYPKLEKYDIKISVNGVLVTKVMKFTSDSGIIVFTPFAGG